MARRWARILRILFRHYATSMISTMMSYSSFLIVLCIRIHSNTFKAALDLDRQYEMLHRKLDIAIGKVHSDSLSWLVFSLTVAVITATFEIWHDARYDGVSLGLRMAAAVIALAFIGLALVECWSRIMSTIRSRLLRLTGLRGTIEHRWKLILGLVACFFEGDLIARR